MEENNNIEESNKSNPMEKDLLEQIKELKDNTVSKDEHNKLRAEYKHLLEDYVNGRTQNAESEERLVDVQKLRSELQKNISNLEYAQNALALREELLRQGKEDVFCCKGEGSSPDEEKEAADKVAGLLQYCIRVADGNNDVFCNELQRHLVDPVIIRKNRR